MSSKTAKDGQEQEAEVRSEELGIRNQESGIRNQESGIRSQESAEERTGNATGGRDEVRGY
jgi:hypothetical protein